MNIFSSTAQEIYDYFSSSEKGLSFESVALRKEAFGKNSLPVAKKRWLKIFLSEFTSPLVFILIAAVFLMLLVPILESGTISFHDVIDPIAIIIIILFNGFLGFFQAWKAENTLEALKTLQPEFASVMRNGTVVKVKTVDLVPGDIIFLAEGEKIPADIRLIESHDCKVNESLLTGESEAVYKTDALATEDFPENIVFSGSELISGRGKGVVVAIGTDTKIGKIAYMLTEIERPVSPMEKKLNVLSKKIGIGMMGLCMLVFVLATMRDISWIDALFTAIALAVAAVPEGLPAVLTISLAIGVSVMARKKTLVRNLQSVESLGAITVIASDKTGTITQNKMSVEKVFLWNDQKKSGSIYEKKEFSTVFAEEYTKKFLSVVENCNDAVLPNIGDPTEIALLDLGRKYNAKKYERVDEVPFSSNTKWMSTTHEIHGEKKEFIKGAPEVLVNHCDENLHVLILEQSKFLAEQGLRTLLIAERKSGEERIAFLGIAALQDPPRENVKESIAIARGAGIRTIMITGDHAITAKAIASQVGIHSAVIEGKDIENMSDEDLQKAVKTVSIFARVTPHHKVDICKALQKNGEVVAMTGDGVNDAPAITQAHVGISMGNIGTSVARNASDIVLLDDNYSTIVKGVEEGRRIFNNIKKAIVFLLATNFSEILVLLLALLLSIPVPLLPLHILFINLLTDSLPALALATEPVESTAMKQKPKPEHEGFFTGSISIILFLGTLIASFVLLFFMLSQKMGATLEQSQTLAFATLALLEMAVVVSLRTHASIFHFHSLRTMNKWVFYAISIVVSISLVAVLTPLSVFLNLESFAPVYWIWIACGSVCIIFLLEIFKHFSKEW